MYIFLKVIILIYDLEQPVCSIKDRVEHVEKFLSILAWIVESKVLVQLANLSHFFLGQSEFEHGCILSHPFGIDRLGDDSCASLHGPSKDYLCR